MAIIDSTDRTPGPESGASLELAEGTLLDFGFTLDGTRSESFAGFTALATIGGTGDVTVVWTLPSGETVPDSPDIATMPGAPQEPIEGFRAEMRAANVAITAQETRFDRFFLPERNWTLGTWREGYAGHPIFGHLAKRLIWHFAHIERKLTGIWEEARNGFVDSDGEPLAELTDETLMRLWHPIGYTPEEVAAWKAYLAAHRITQPFKQAHREVYLPTEIERSAPATDRFANIVLAEAATERIAFLRDWERIPEGLTKSLPEFGLQIVFVAPLRNGTDASEAIRVTGPIHFLRDGDGTPIESVPPLVFSEILREAETIVRGAGVETDPFLSSDHPLYSAWEKVAFGDLLPGAITRREVLADLLPSLSIASRLSLKERTLSVSGAKRTYEIHLGSGKTLASIGPAEAPLPPDVVLPFEGDEVLVVLLRTAIALATDDPWGG